MIALFLKGILTGLIIAAPMGPVGVLCVQRTLRHHTASGLVAGLGSAFADAIYGGIAIYGVVILEAFIKSHAFWFRLVGGIILLLFGLRMVLSSPVKSKTTISAIGMLRDFSATFFLTLSNPMPGVGFIAIYAALGIATTHIHAQAAAAVITGVLLGSISWWIILCTTTALFRPYVNNSFFKWINWVTGSIILIFGVVVLSSLM